VRLDETARPAISAAQESWNLKKNELSTGTRKHC
jgi:hypothetical protein